MNLNFIRPASLTDGDVVAIVSPASAVRPDLVDGAAEAITRNRWVPRIYPSAKSCVGSYSAAAADRLDDLRSALLDPEVKAILCARGGYGAVQLLPELDKSFRNTPFPKWLIGFSDISALHALWNRHHVCSLHGPMAKHWTSESQGAIDEWTILRGGSWQIQSRPSALNRPGQATGHIAGGNLAVLADLFGTPFNLISPGSILIIEDIAEPIYKVERILWQLRLSGVLGQLKGLVVGAFTDYRSDLNYQSMEAMIADMVAGYTYPVAMGMPIGHIDDNRPFVEGATCQFIVDENGASLSPLC